MDTEANGRNIYAKFDLNSSHKHARGWLQWRAMGQKISKEDDSQYEVEVIVEMMSGKAGGCSPLLLCLSSTVSLMTLISAQVGCNDNALPGLVDVRLIQWYSGAFIVACLSMTGVIGDSDVWHHLGQR